MLFLKSHLGLGDHFLCNGMVRYFAKDDSVTLHVKRTYMDSVKAMYSDLGDRIRLLDPFIEPKADRFIDATLGSTDDHMKFDEEFYKNAGVPFEYRWRLFHAPRINGLFLMPKPYIFVHDDVARGFVITRGLEGKRIFAPQPYSEVPITAYRRIIQEAREVHCINSSFACWIDSANLVSKERFFVHRYAREDGSWCTFRNATVIR